MCTELYERACCVLSTSAFSRGLLIAESLRSSLNARARKHSME